MPNVQSVVRSFRLLEALTTGELGITELADRTDLPKSTVARLIRTLEGVRAVERVDDDGRYRIGPQIVSLAGVASPTANLVSIVRPHLRLLAEMTGEDAGLAVPDGHRVHHPRPGPGHQLDQAPVTAAEVEDPLPLDVAQELERVMSRFGQSLVKISDAFTSDYDRLMRRLSEMSRASA